MRDAEESEWIHSISVVVSVYVYSFDVFAVVGVAEWAVGSELKSIGRIDLKDLLMKLIDLLGLMGRWRD